MHWSAHPTMTTTIPVSVSSANQGKSSYSANNTMLPLQNIAHTSTTNVLAGVDITKHFAIAVVQRIHLHHVDVLEYESNNPFVPFQFHLSHNLWQVFFKQ